MMHAPADTRVTCRFCRRVREPSAMRRRVIDMRWRWECRDADECNAFMATRWTSGGSDGA